MTNATTKWNLHYNGIVELQDTVMTKDEAEGNRTEPAVSHYQQTSLTSLTLSSTLSLFFVRVFLSPSPSRLP